MIRTQRTKRFSVRLTPTRFEKISKVADCFGGNCTRGLDAILDAIDPAAVAANLEQKKSAVLTEQVAHSALQGSSQL